MAPGIALESGRPEEVQGPKHPGQQSREGEDDRPIDAPNAAPLDTLGTCIQHISAARWSTGRVLSLSHGRCMAGSGGCRTCCVTRLSSNHRAALIPKSLHSPTKGP